MPEGVYKDYQEIHNAVKRGELKIGDITTTRAYGGLTVEIVEPEYKGEIDALGLPIKYRIKEVTPTRPNPPAVEAVPEVKPIGKIDRVELSYKSIKEINAIREAVESNPKNLMPEGSFHIYMPKARKQLDDIAWAVTNKLAREAKPPAVEEVKKGGNPMTQEAEKRCDIDDMLCQMVALSHLKGLKNVLGEERYRTEFPELQSLDEKITSREASLRDTLGKCGLEPVVEAEVTLKPTEEEEI